MIEPIDITELTAMCNRLCGLMGWEPSTAHKFDIIRATCGGKAAALSIDKGNQIADQLEILERIRKLAQANCHPGVNVERHRAFGEVINLFFGYGEPANDEIEYLEP